MIKAVGHVGLQVPNLDRSVQWATTVMGLREVTREGGTAYLTHGGVHHSLQYVEADFDGEHILVSSPVGSRKGRSFREREQVAVSIVSNNNGWHWVSVSGRVIDWISLSQSDFLHRIAARDLQNGESASSEPATNLTC